MKPGLDHLNLFQNVKESVLEDLAVLQAFAAHYKETFYADLARARIEEVIEQHRRPSH
jgi:hypothetical protein